MCGETNEMESSRRCGWVEWDPVWAVTGAVNGSKGQCKGVWFMTLLARQTCQSSTNAGLKGAGLRQVTVPRTSVKQATDAICLQTSVPFALVQR